MQSICDGLLLGGIVSHATAPQGRAQGGVVDGYNSPQSGYRLLAKNHLLVTLGAHVIKNFHTASPLLKILQLSLARGVPRKISRKLRLVE